MKNRKIVSFSMSPATYRNFKVFCYTRGIKMSDTVEALVLGHMKTNAHLPEDQEPKYIKKEVDLDQHLFDSIDDE